VVTSTFTDRARETRYIKGMSDAPAKAALVPAVDVPAAPAKAPDPAPVPATDVVILGPPTADGAGVHVLRAREEKVEIGELRALEEGRPIAGEVVTLSPRKDNPRVCDVKDSFRAAPSLSLAHKGPAKVATEAYRDGWDEIFSKKPTPPSAAN
jgi:hypothetical protein